MRKSQVNSYRPAWIFNEQSAINYLNILFTNEPDLIPQYHPDSTFEDYKDQEGNRLYNDKEAKHRNILKYHVYQAMADANKLDAEFEKSILQQHGRIFEAKPSLLVWTRIGAYVTVPLPETDVAEGAYNLFEGNWNKQVKMLADKINAIEGIRIEGDTYAPGEPEWLDDEGSEQQPKWRPNHPEMSIEL